MNVLGTGAIPPGTVDPFSQQALFSAFGNADQAMHNRYTQLGLGVPAQGNVGGPGGTAAQAAAHGQNLTYGGMGTPEAMDRSFAPSLVGGLGAEASATLGQEQLNALNAGNVGNTSKGNSGLGGLGSLLGL